PHVPVLGANRLALGRVPAVQRVALGSVHHAVAVRVYRLLQAVAIRIILVVRPRQERAAVGGPVLGPDQLFLVVVAVRPRLGVCAFGLLGQVSFAVVAVRPGAVPSELVARADGPAAIVAVAVGVVGVGVRPIRRQLIRCVVAIGDARAVDHLAR